MMPIKHATSSQTLSSLLHGFVDITNLDDVEVKGITANSRTVKAGDLFIAYQHPNVLNHINAAIESEASAIVVQVAQLGDIPRYNLPVIALPQLHEQAGLIASKFFSYPTHGIHVIGVTGTNGKTTVSHLITQAFEQQNPGKNSVIGTLGYGQLEQLSQSPNTTPEPIALQGILAKLCQQEMHTVTMEVSSHSLDQYRVSGVEFDIAVFTNLSRDHLDYHQTMPSYMKSKRRLFKDHIVNKAVINLDDAYGSQLFNEFQNKLEIVGYTFNANKQYDSPTIVAKIIHNHNGLKLEISSPWGKGVLSSNLIGRFNAENLLASLAVLCLSDIAFSDALSSLSKCSGVTGRMEFFRCTSKPVVVVDYAHTPDSLKQVLQTLQSQSPAKLICVFGCGGQRDQGKRAEMGRIAEMFADHIFLTNDNPRYESPKTIIEDIVDGIKDHARVTKEMDRSIAIMMAIQSASKDDLVLVAGKGHEDYQEINGVSIPSNDRLIVKEIIYGFGGDLND